MLPNSSLRSSTGLIESVTSIEGATPVPLRLTSCGVPARSSVNVSFEATSADGWKVTVSVHSPLAGRLMVQSAGSAIPKGGAGDSVIGDCSRASAEVLHRDGVRGESAGRRIAEGHRVIGRAPLRVCHLGTKTTLPAT